MCPGDASLQIPAARERRLCVAHRVPDGSTTARRPDIDNVLDDTTLRELPLAWEAFRADGALRVAIFTGAGDKAFCGGVDIATFRSAPAPRPAISPTTPHERTKRNPDVARPKDGTRQLTR